MSSSDRANKIITSGISSQAGAGFIKSRNFTSNYAVYWSQLAATIQCSIQPVS